MYSRFGLWAAISACVASIGYGIPQVLQVMGVLPTPLDRILIFAPSLLLAPCFVVTMAALHAVAPANRHPWSLASLALAIMYGVLACIVYITQLGVVIPGELLGEREMAAIFACCEPRHFLTGVDLLGYTLMSISTLFAAPVFPARGPGAAARWWLIANGVLAPALILQLAAPWLIAVGALWLITFPAAMIAMAMVFGRAPSA